MRTPLMTAFLWLGATALAVAVGLFATSLVADRVAGDPLALPLDVAREAGVAPPAPDGARPALPVNDGRPPTLGATDGADATDPTDAAEGAGATDGPGATETVDDAAPVSPSPAPAPEQTRTLSTVGGTAALRFADGRVEVVWATPNAGFSAEVEHDPDGFEARVDFRSADHRSRIKGEWEGGVPHVETEERPDG